MSDATRVAIIGLGAIGGSVALKLLERGARPRGYTTAPEDSKAAAAVGISVAPSIAEAVQDADLVLIAVPLDALAGVAEAVVDHAPATSTVFHAAGLQRPAAVGLTGDRWQRVVGTHPLAGTHRSGFDAARPDLFHGATVYVESRISGAARDDAQLFWSMAGAGRVVYLDAVDHDILMGQASHLPQLIATTLAAVYADLDLPAHRLGPAGRDMTRLAASNLAMWQPLLQRTPAETLFALDAMLGRLAQLRDGVATGAAIDGLWRTAQQWRAELEQR